MVNRLKLLEQFSGKKLDVRIRNVCSPKGFSILKEKIAKYREMVSNMGRTVYCN